MIAAVNLDFDCTQCARCCQRLRLPLTLAEALRWLADGHPVQVLCEALPWPAEPAADDAAAAHKRRRSFAADSGSLPVRVVVVLAVSLEGACPYLRADGACGQYATRPLVCRIYPAEVHPLLALEPAHKACPPEAWAPGRTPLLRGGKLVDARVEAWVRQSRDADAASVGAKQRLCALLGLQDAAMANDGWVIHAPDPGALQAALRSLVLPGAAAEAPVEPTNWRLVSNQRETLQILNEIGARTVFSDAGLPGDVVFQPLRPA